MSGISEVRPTLTHIMQAEFPGVQILTAIEELLYLEVNGVLPENSRLTKAWDEVKKHYPYITAGKILTIQLVLGKMCQDLVRKNQNNMRFE